jgi:hypothetical protein
LRSRLPGINGPAGLPTEVRAREQCANHPANAPSRRPPGSAKHGPPARGLNPLWRSKRPPQPRGYADQPADTGASQHVHSDPLPGPARATAVRRGSRRQSKAQATVSLLALILSGPDAIRPGSKIVWPKLPAAVVINPTGPSIYSGTLYRAAAALTSHIHSGTRSCYYYPAPNRLFDPVRRRRDVAQIEAESTAVAGARGTRSGWTACRAADQIESRGSVRLAGTAPSA